MPYHAKGNDCIVYLLRHGATANNLANPPVLQGRNADPELSDEGRRQSDVAARLLAERPLAAAYASPMRRAVETAERVVAARGLTVTTVPELTEIDVGAWEGRSWDEIARSEPEAYARFMSDPAAHPYRDGESLGQLHERVSPAIKRLMRAHLGEEILVAAHNVVNRVFLAEMLGLPMSEARALSQENGCVNVIRLRREEFKLLTFNAAFHLL